MIIQLINAQTSCAWIVVRFQNLMNLLLFHFILTKCLKSETGQWRSQHIRTVMAEANRERHSAACPKGIFTLRHSHIEARADRSNLGSSVFPRDIWTCSQRWASSLDRSVSRARDITQLSCFSLLFLSVFCTFSVCCFYIVSILLQSTLNCLLINNTCKPVLPF